MSTWRQHPRLRDRFHPQAPDDLQVVVHDGGPRLTDRRPEQVWVHVVAMEGEVLTGDVLNAPHQLTSVRQGDRIQFLAPASGEPVQVRPRYLAERGAWRIHPCSRCGLAELFDAPSDLIARVFPDLPPGARLEQFTAICGVCGGTQGVESLHQGVDEAPDKKWWQFWRR